MPPRVSAVVLAYLDEPWLERCVESLLSSEGADVDVVLVDNGATGEAVDRLSKVAGVTVVRPARNLGFAGGCNAGAEAATADLVAFVNSDAVVEPRALAHLAMVASEPDVGIASASIRLAHAPDRLNSGGNDVHFLGFVWSGAFEEEAAAWPVQRDVGAASGAGMALRRVLWENLGGFDPAYFAYYEDAELSLRCWQRGLRVVYVPEAVVVHRYEFSRNPEKNYLLERNRLILVLTLFEGRTLALLAPALVGIELAVLLFALVGGWAGNKLAGWTWILRHRRWLAARRRQLQEERTVGDRDLAHLLVSGLDPGNYPVPEVLRPLNVVLTAYWALVRRFL
jgi:GT2 family glycosyltransferase